MRSGTAVLSVLLAALAMPACGGDDDGDVSREDYADQVNRVCRDVERQLNELGIAEPQTRDEITQLIDDVIARSQAAVDRLQALERPGGDAGETADRFVDTLERELERQLLPALEDLKTRYRARIERRPPTPPSASTCCRTPSRTASRGSSAPTPAPPDGWRFPPPNSPG
jgi:hypothetical protein